MIKIVDKYFFNARQYVHRPIAFMVVVLFLNACLLVLTILYVNEHIYRPDVSFFTMLIQLVTNIEVLLLWFVFLYFAAVAVTYKPLAFDNEGLCYCHGFLLRKRYILFSWKAVEEVYVSSNGDDRGLTFTIHASPSLIDFCCRLLNTYNRIDDNHYRLNIYSVGNPDKLVKKLRFYQRKFAK